MPEYDYDRFGYCVLCSKQVIVKEFIGGKEQQRMLPDYAEAELLMNDGSRMRVCCCTSCLKDAPLSLDTIMTKVYKGWQYEVAELKWTDEQKKDYLDRYSKLSIVRVL